MEERLARTLNPKRRKRMAEAISLLKRASSRLADWCKRRRVAAENTEAKAFEKLKREARRDPERWRQGHAPLLRAKSGQPWVKDVLRHLAGLAVSA